MTTPTADCRAERLFDLVCQLADRLRTDAHDLTTVAHEARQEAAWLAGYVQAAAARNAEGGAR